MAIKSFFHYHATAMPQLFNTLPLFTSALYFLLSIFYNYIYESRKIVTFTLQFYLGITLELVETIGVGR